MTAPDTDRDVFHLLPADAWRTALRDGVVVAPSLAEEGFVHTTHGWRELVAVANRYYAADARPYLALRLDLDRVRAPWRYDAAGPLYPHVYGPIPVAAVTAVRPMPRNPAGSFRPREEVPMSSLAPHIDRMEAAHARLAATRAAVVAGAPWPATATEAGAAEEVWGPGEILAHLSEAMRFWLGEVERLLAGADGHGGGEAQIGRTPGDPIRELSVKRDATLPPAELYDRIASEVERYRRRLPELTEADIARVGRHPVRGPMSVADIVDRLVAGHLEDHAAQMERAIGG